jgi:hypothetical protein
LRDELQQSIWMMRTLSCALVSIFVLSSGCGIPLHKSGNNPPEARLAAKQQELSRLTDPVAKSRCYMAIAETTLDMVFDTVQRGDLDRMKELLKDYDSAIQGSRDTLFQATRKLPASAFRNFEIALRSDIRRLESLNRSLSIDEREAVSPTLQDANEIRAEVFKALFPNVPLPGAVASQK